MSHSIRYSGRNWMPLDYGISGMWNLETLVDLRIRSDSNAPNRSPVTSYLPVYTYVAFHDVYTVKEQNYSPKLIFYKLFCNFMVTKMHITWHHDLITIPFSVLQR